MTHEDQPPLSPPMDAISDTMLPPGPESLRDLPTSPENLKPSPYDTDFIRKLDPEFARAIEVMATLGRDIVADREERRALAERSAENQKTLIEQQNEVIEILLRTEKATKANHEIMQLSLSELKSSIAHHDGRLVGHDAMIGTLRSELDGMRDEMAANIATSIEVTLRPYVERLDEIERALSRDSDGPPEAPPTTQ